MPSARDLRPARTITATERRARLARRHHLAAGHRATDVTTLAARLVALHATDSVTTHLGAWARVTGYRREDLDRALHDDRTLVKQLAMRRTQFVFPRATLPAAVGGVGLRVAEAARRRLAQDVERVGVARDGRRWVGRARRAVLELLADGQARTTAEVRAALPILDGAIPHGEGRTWAGRQGLAGLVLTVLWAEGAVVRAASAGDWVTPRPRWTTPQAWLGAPLEPAPVEAGVAELVAGWLAAFGPGTEADLRWWLGSTLGAVRRALHDVGAVPVDLDGRVGYVLADDLDEVPPPDPWVALLPGLDPTVMGWKERDWYLGGYRGDIFDTAGNAGPTVWCDGRIVGAWDQAPDGSVVLLLLEDVGDAARDALEARAAELTAWLDGRLLPRYPAPIARRRAAQGGPGR